ncbi:ANTAR domain-containing protein [Nocardia abscessus]|uniref:ANTAR domain-containing protein n=1 Tax=Nocardia abscessus TaxID=120957 RepID=UPI0018931ECD|nr:ANTAR domain-containing protein [Nocardia abscessus]MBF6335547.1 ANTAR domain-containing protein [Nocardia abscessus]
MDTEPRPSDDVERFAFDATRAVIEQAKGIVMLLYGIGDERAFALLRSCSQNTGVRVHALAQRIVTELPGSGGQHTVGQLRAELDRIMLGPPPPRDPGSAPTLGPTRDAR